MGIRTLGPLRWDRDSLWIPRFDRVPQKIDIGGYIHPMERIGLESLIAAAGVAEFGANLNHEIYLNVIAQYSTSPTQEIFEYILRDFLNICCGNTDNHGRNTSFMRLPSGRVELSPLFDFAPMVLDDSGIARASRWQHEVLQIPNLHQLQQDLFQNHKISLIETEQFLIKVFENLENLKELMVRNHIDSEVVELATKKYEPFMIALKAWVTSK